MINILKISLILLFMPMLSVGQSKTRQEKIYNKAIEAYSGKDYSMAVREAQKLTGPESGYLPAFLLMADISRDQGNYEDELVWLRKSAGFNDAPSLVFYRIGDACFKTGNYAEGWESINRLNGKNVPSGLVEKFNRLKVNLRFAKEAIKRPVRFTPEKLNGNINSRYDEYWPSMTVDDQKLIFTRLLPQTGIPSLKQEDFYFSVRDSAGWTAASPISHLNSALNEGAQSISADGSLLFYTLCNHPEGYGSCDIWYSRMESGSWSSPRNAGEPVNTPGWDGQPSFSAFGNRLYFSSSRTGGKGNKDIWSIRLKEWDPAGNPVWTDPVNLGDSLNTSGDEISPFIHPNGKDLYFSSDGWPGFGGLDLFHSEIKENKAWTQPSNLGYPVNSPGNEQGLIIDRTGMTAYFATNRSQNSDMDIHSFETDESFRPDAVTYIRGKVVNARTGRPVSATVGVNTGTGKQSGSFEIKAGEDGIFLITLPPVTEALFTVKEKGYLFYSERFETQTSSSETLPIERMISLMPAEPGSFVNLYNIFFNTGEYTILPESESELKTLLSFLRENPSLSVEIGGHTDNVGTVEFNRLLSEKRADSVKKYLMLNDIHANRLSVKGYGMEQPVASNDSEEGRARNRRTTIRILSV